MFHIACIQFVAPPALLDTIKDVEAVRAEVVAATLDDGVVALAITAVGRQPGLEVVLRADHVFGQGIHQMLRLDAFLAVLARRVAFGRNDDGFAAMRAFEFDLRFGVIAHQTAQRRDLVVKGVGNGGLEAAGAACFRRIACLACSVQLGLERFELGGQILPVPLHRPIRVGDLAAEVVEVAIPPAQ